jgi:hypothetical protein
VLPTGRKRKSSVAQRTAPIAAGGSTIYSIDRDDAAALLAAEFLWRLAANRPALEDALIVKSCTAKSP